MPFKQVFERRVNEQMREGEAGPAARSPSPTFDTDVKKQPQSPKATSIHEAEDLDFSEKKDKSLPPRFSTLFGTTNPAPLPPTPRIVECCHREKKKSGIHLSTPVFILLIVVLLFESTLLFAYTVIGLYQNLPSGLLVSTGAPPPVDGCHCEEKQAAINFSPNFILGEGGSSMGQLSIIESVVTSEQTSMIPSSTAATSFSSAKSQPTSSTGTTSAAAQAASQILNLFGDDDDDKPSISIVTATPGVVQSTIIVTSSADPTAGPTVTSVHIVDGPETTIQARSPTSTAAEEAAPTDSGEPGAESADAGTEAESTPQTSEDGDGDADDAGPGVRGESEGNTVGACFGGSGAVMLNCV